jgi:hypothetical protein
MNVTDKIKLDLVRVQAEDDDRERLKERLGIGTALPPRHIDTPVQPETARDRIEAVSTGERLALDPNSTPIDSDRDERERAHKAGGGSDAKGRTLYFMSAAERRREIEGKLGAKDGDECSPV